MAHIDEILLPILDPVTDYMALGAMGIIVGFGIAEIIGKFIRIIRQ